MPDNFTAQHPPSFLGKLGATARQSARVDGKTAPVKKSEAGVSSPTIVSKYFEFLKWLIVHVSKYPRAHRYTLGQRIENQGTDIYEALLRASLTSSDKLAILTKTNLELEILRHHLRMATDLHLCTDKQYRFAIVRINEIGQQLGGWIKSTAAKAIADKQQQSKTVSRP